METPSVVHPKKFGISGMIFEIVTFSSVTDEIAAKIAMHFYKSRKFKKSDKGKLFRVVSLFDRDSINIL